MSDNGNFGFARLVPGFDFLQNLAKGASQSIPQMPTLASWVAPTLNVEELEKRITELKAVQFWLDQNGKALAATIQALEVQKMTLATLEGMNVSMGELANALKVQTADAMAGGAQKLREATGAAAKAASPTEEAGPAAAKPKKAAGKGDGNGSGSGAAIDPLQWWGALTQQFQQIAVDAMKDVAQKATVEKARGAAGAVKAAAGRAKGAAAPASSSKPPAAAPAEKAARKAPARKARAKTS